MTHEQLLYLDSLKKALEIAIQSLNEASEYANKDDCNGFAGQIALDAVSKIKNILE